QSAYDNAAAQFKQAEARVGEIRATIERKTIRAPFSGQLGIREVNLGQYLESGKPIVSLQSLHPVDVHFTVPQQEIGALSIGADAGAVVTLTGLFVARPVLAMVVNLVILIAGLQSIRSRSVRQFPRSDMADVVVTAAYVGANADLVRGFITAPLERVIAGADGIDFLESSSAQGISTITAHLKLNYDTNAALTQIQSKVAQVRNQLPPEAEAPIIELETA